MTEVETDVEVVNITSIEEALALIDKGLGVMIDRQLVSTSEVTDLLLDVRALLSVSSAAS
jgi:Tfp pilus assembly protein PilO